MALGPAESWDDYEQGPYAERAVNAKGAVILNDATWDHVGIRCVIGTRRRATSGRFKIMADRSRRRSASALTATTESRLLGLGLTNRSR